MGKYNHPPFEEWLLAQEPLSADQSRTLQEHLQGCEPCRQLEGSLAGMERMLRTAPQVGPRPGFNARWQERLAKQRLQQQRRQTWLMFGASASLAALLLALLGIQIASLFSSTTQVLLLKAYLISTVVNLSEAFASALALGRTVATGLTVTGLIFVSGFTSFISVLWIVTYRQLTSTARRISL